MSAKLIYVIYSNENHAVLKASLIDMKILVFSLPNKGDEEETYYIDWKKSVVYSLNDKKVGKIGENDVFSVKDPNLRIGTSDKLPWFCQYIFFLSFENGVEWIKSTETTIELSKKEEGVFDFSAIKKEALLLGEPTGDIDVKNIF